MKRKGSSQAIRGGKVSRLIKGKTGDKCRPVVGIVAFHHKEIGRVGGRGIKGGIGKKRMTCSCVDESSQR